MHFACHDKEYSKHCNCLYAEFFSINRFNCKLIKNIFYGNLSKIEKHEHEKRCFLKHPTPESLFV